MQVLSVNRPPTADCISIEIGYDESLVVASPEGNKPMQQAIQQAIQLVQSLMPVRRRVIKATLCLSDEEYEILQKPTVGDEVDLQVSPEGVAIRFIKR
jgi:hypothetical protein